ncbi:ABC transporter ATP-binding protein [Bacillus sp. FJAT-49732]|uniref:ABC transporter ATP-binding protein n=1 Tax=Lederbergia citrisecunda TaxID=2833583 RepID=A0A942YM15_9BACI|nr:ABC transporter ATP-binding protein [Lederbergia citrisecunda]MBS4200989.1 ABC transporter ATP-binding protein [Lederbergia citrisecunda]
MLLTVEKLSKKYKEHVAVKELTLNIEHNQCVALLGPNGSGKTTTLNMLSGLLTPTSGKIVFQGGTTINRQDIGFLPQYPAFFSWMTAIEYLQFAGKLSNLSKRELQNKSNEMLSFVGLEEAKNKRIGGFSGGMKQRLGLAQAMLHDPKLLILDEPVSALDPTGRRDVLNIMMELKKKMAILFSTHVLHDAEQVCDHIIMLKEGTVKWAGSLDSLRKRKIEETFILSTEEKLEDWIKSKEYVKEYLLTSPTSAEIKLHEASRNRLLEDCITNHMTINRFEVKNHTLEDAYMEVVNQ